MIWIWHHCVFCNSGIARSWIIILLSPSLQNLQCCGPPVNLFSKAKGPNLLPCSVGRHAPRSIFIALFYFYSSCLVCGMEWWENLEIFKIWMCPGCLHCFPFVLCLFCNQVSFQPVPLAFSCMFCRKKITFTVHISFDLEFARPFTMFSLSKSLVNRQVLGSLNASDIMVRILLLREVR